MGEKLMAVNTITGFFISITPIRLKIGKNSSFLFKKEQKSPENCMKIKKRKARISILQAYFSLNFNLLLSILRLSLKSHMLIKKTTCMSSLSRFRSPGCKILNSKILEMGKRPYFLFYSKGPSF